MLLAAMPRGFQQMEQQFPRIPGLSQLFASNGCLDAAAQYPEAAFVYRIATEPLHRDSEINHINYTALRAILDGDSVENARFHHERAMDQYTKLHMWDD